ncbi:hypothetical protein K443DRAFT_678328 [Laccaria amethystina LaAM-08-1]|uniref:Vacuolar protein sorting-associated protein 9 n=1 Tax=Laccaria amethystina LaAM-08-1 TaxID=1095629 RepID=A0A0C9XJ19_9AGAR|nr:hypothetical protein K443DRAFT_678328 [Laccaria amethystina LaAM-08-1]
MASVKDDKQDQATSVTDEPETAPSIAPPVVDVIPNSPNPWNDHVTESEKATVAEEPQFKPLTTPDLSLYDQGIFGALKQDSPTVSEPRTNVSRDVLNEFDPLANLEEQYAQNAWETSESHPPPPRTPSPPPPPQKDQIPVLPPSSPETSTPSSSSSFPSLAALARTFSIPLARPRPMSIDVARNVPSPATLSSFAAQQDASSTNPVSRSGTPHASGSGTASPVSGSKDKGIETAFDFQKFLDQMKTRSADPVSKYLRSFLSNFAKRTFTVNDQVKIINDFLAFISGQMRTCDVWKSCSDAEFDNAMEGMEKLVMNRLYDFTFTPQLSHVTPPRPITTDDLERDRVLSQRIALFGWVEEEHLDIPQGEGSKGFLMFAQQELLKINHYKAPRDKLICILNCCKVIFGLIRHLKKEEGADSFIPILIFVVLKANPEHLLSNVEFINRFRNPAKLQSEAGYYLSSLMGAVSFIETMDHTSLSNIDQELFEKNVEEAIQALPPSEPQSPSTPFADAKVRPIINSSLSPHAGEESAQLLSLSTPAQTLSEDAKRLLQKTGDTISKPLNAIGRIFTEALDGAENKLSYLPGPFAPFELGREQRQGEAVGTAPPPVPTWSHSDQWQQQQQAATPRSAQIPQTPFGADGAYSPPLQTPYKPRVRRVASPSAYAGGSPAGSPGYGGPEDTPSRSGPFTNQALTMGPSQSLIPPRVGYLAAGGDGPHISRTPTPNLDLAGMQAQIDSAHEQAAEESRETLAQIFPGVDGEVVEWVLEANEGDLGKSIEALLEMTSGT